MLKQLFYQLIIVGLGLGQPRVADASTTPPILSHNAIHHPVRSHHAMVASQNHYATKAGLKILRQGGNAVDAAVCVAFVLAVTLPRAGNIGGGGFMLVFDANAEKTSSIDYRERAPAAATETMFVDANGAVDTHKSRRSHLAVGVPGTVAGLTLALKQHGTMPLKELMAPAIALARDGIIIDHNLEASLTAVHDAMRHSPASMQVFYKRDHSVYRSGELWRQPDLAKSLQAIAEHGRDAFYTGSISQAIITAMQTGGGLIDANDLAHYQAVVRTPITASFHGTTVASMPPPSSGGLHIAQILQVLDHFPLAQWGPNSSRSIHVMAEIMKRAYADRSKYLGDPDFVTVPIDALLDPNYARRLAASIDLRHAKPSQEIGPRPLEDRESNDTTHFSIVDKWGNAVANTYTLNFSFGSKITVPGTGILLNNQMDDFSAKPGTANAYGLTGGKANAIAPKKRMLSSMSPTIVSQNGRVVLVTGSPGGSRIITSVLQLLINVFEYNMNIAEATHAPRFHHQWFPDELRLEKGFSADTQRLLKRMGHTLAIRNTMGSLQSIHVVDGWLHGASDPRRGGALTLGY